MRVIFRTGTVRHSNFRTLPQKTAKGRAGHEVCSIAVEDSTAAVSIAARCIVGPTRPRVCGLCEPDAYFMHLLAHQAESGWWAEQRQTVHFRAEHYSY